jgi:hypothetical protein
MVRSPCMRHMAAFVQSISPKKSFVMFGMQSFYKFCNFHASIKIFIHLMTLLPKLRSYNPPKYRVAGHETWHAHASRPMCCRHAKKRGGYAPPAGVFIHFAFLAQGCDCDGARTPAAHKVPRGGTRDLACPCIKAYVLQACKETRRIRAPCRCFHSFCVPSARMF